MVKAASPRSEAKFGVDIKKYCKIKKYENIKTDVKSFNGKSTRGWRGLKRKGGMEDDTVEDP